MNALSKKTIRGELISPSEVVSIYGTTDPLNSVTGARIHCKVPAGLSITEILIEALKHKPGFELRRDLIVTLKDQRAESEIVIPEKNWSKVRLKPGTVLTFTPRMQGNPALLRQALGVAIAITAIIAAAPTGGLSLALAGAISVSAATASALIAGGIILAGTLALNALFPIAKPSDEAESTQLNSIQGAQNSANLFGPVPSVLGRHRQSPYLGAKQYTEIIGDDQYLRTLFCLGYGPLLIEEIKIGETLLTSFKNYSIEVLQGFPSDADPTLYPGSVDEVALSITLAGGADWSRQTTAAETDEITLDFTAPSGISATDPNGNDIQITVSISTRYRKVGTVSWTNGPSVTFGRNYNPSRKGIRLTVARDQYEVETIRTTPNYNQKYSRDEVVWTAIRSFKKMDPVNFPNPLAFIALRIKATAQLSGSISTLNCITTSLVKAFSGSPSIWVDNTPSQNPADLFRHVLQNPANARPVPDDEIDIECLEEWWSYCTTKGFKFNQIRNSVSSVSDVLNDIAVAGRAVKTFKNGKWAVVWDKPEDPMVQHFTTRNSWGFSGQKPFVQKPHGWRIPFINEDNGFTQDERIVYDDGYDSTNATLFEGIQFVGVTDPDLIYKHGRFHIAQSRLRPEKFTLSCGWDHLVCTKGDRVRVTHDVPLIGSNSARVKSVIGQVVTFDETFTIEDGKTYGLQFRVPEDIRSFNRAVAVTPAGDYNSLTLIGDLSLVEEGTLFGFGETNLESAMYRVQSISNQGDLIAQLTLVDDAPEISNADSGVIPEYNPNVTIPVDQFSLPPRNLQYVEVIDGQGAAVRALVRLFWQVPRFGKIVSFEIQRRDDDAGEDFITVDSVPAPKTSVDVPVTTAGTWSFRVRCIFDFGHPSNWTSLIGLNIVGTSAAPDNISNLHIKIIDGQTALDWSAIVDQRIISYEIRKGTTWDTGLVVGDTVTQPPWPTTGDGTYHVRAYVVSPFAERIYSEETASIIIADSIIYRNIIESKNEQADGWTGSLDGGVIDGSFIRTDAGETISDPSAQEVIDDLELTGEHICIYLSPNIINVGKPAECRFWTRFEAVGNLIGDDFLAMTDVLASQDILGASPTRNIRAFPIWRFASSGESDVFAPTDIFAEADAFTAGIEWGPWTAIASGTRVSRYFQPGFVLITDSEDTNATGTKFEWFVDVPDRTDDYINLDVPDTGLDIVFYEGGYTETPAPGIDPTPFNGGPNGSSVPHIQCYIVDGTDGDEVKVTNLTANGCTIHVVNAGINVTRSGVNLLARGY